MPEADLPLAEAPPLRFIGVTKQQIDQESIFYGDKPLHYRNRQIGSEINPFIIYSISNFCQDFFFTDF